MIDHPRVARSWIEWEIAGGSFKPVLVVEVDMELQPDQPGFDSSILDDVTTAALFHAGAVSAVRLEPLRRHGG